jgi:hypothetical protein
MIYNTLIINIKSWSFFFRGYFGEDITFIITLNFIIEEAFGIELFLRFKSLLDVLVQRG